MRPQTAEQEGKSRKRPKLTPIQSNLLETQPDEQVKPVSAEKPEILQLQFLMERIPARGPEVAPDVASRLAPVLDRVLCTVTSLDQKTCQAIVDHQIVKELLDRLFGLIDIEDFLLRVIVCRILLAFAPDENSRLLLPISNIFYQLSCEPMNCPFFAEESVDAILLTLVRIGSIEGRALAARALANLAKSEEMRKRLAESDLFNIGFDVFHDKVEGHALRKSVLRVFRRMCQESQFRGMIAESHFLSMAANDKSNYCAVLKLVRYVPEMSPEEKCDFLEAFARIEYRSDEVIRRTVDCLGVVSKTVEELADCAATVNKLVKAVKGNCEDLAILLDIGLKCQDPEGIFARETIYREIADSTEYDSVIKSVAGRIAARST
jgi:hypothetical protein